MDQAERERLSVECAKIKTGDIMAFVYYGRVSDATLNGRHLRLDGVGPGAPAGFAVEGDTLIVNSYSADQVHKEVKTTMTKVASYILDAGIRPFTVCFVKMGGEERTMRCRLLGNDSETVLGRVMVVDLDKGATSADKAEIRQVDLRTVKWLILDGVKYVVGR
jgi:hypothetical protein